MIYHRKLIVSMHRMVQIICICTVFYGGLHFKMNSTYWIYFMTFKHCQFFRVVYCVLNMWRDESQ